MYPLKTMRVLSLLFMLWCVIAGGVFQSVSSKASHSQHLKTVHTPFEHAPPDNVRCLAEQTLKGLNEKNCFGKINQLYMSYHHLHPNGTSWLITIATSVQQVGYFIVHYVGKQNTYRLGEYGFTPSLLYNYDRLEQTLLAYGVRIDKIVKPFVTITKNYIQPMLAYWKVERLNNEDPLYIDAGNGDFLPQKWMKQLERQQTVQSSSVDVQKNVMHKDSFISSMTSDSVFTASACILHNGPSPYDNLLWTQASPIAIQSEPLFLKKWDSDRFLVFDAAQNNILYSGPLAIHGYHLWHEVSTEKPCIYVCTHNGAQIRRFVPLHSLLHNGIFYPMIF